jgi:hypothetical protein
MSKPRPTVDLGYPTEAHGRIPAFNNIEEEAEFWDTHDVTEFVGNELKPVEVTIGGELADRLTVRLEQADREALDRRARDKGVGPSTLVRMWVKERLRQEAEVEARSG